MMMLFQSSGRRWSQEQRFTACRLSPPRGSVSEYNRPDIAAILTMIIAKKE
jgi:hypothetical protein